ncbi:TetR/AcrR family transcriptional regulator [Oceanicoccus sp. KOV_DT_Chl]|uniref:TetR/AcrR family transcriptional regulator n=1 Tax=Oceanicoccus sp. KOV_DT_Chl TaxID=1904639 RepID=UPI001F1DC8DF|nr:helix-turn-helix domain-containing protein [Oceanicoccus sp. KOV_DT_Chl]
MGTLSTELVGRRERKKQLQRDRICDEAMQLIGLHGVEGTTIDAICDCADIAKKTFYNYYCSKHDLLSDICQSKLLNQTAILVDEALMQSDDLAVQLDYVFAVMASRNRQAGKLERELIDYMVGNLSSNRAEGAGQLSFMNDYFLRLFSASNEHLKEGLTADFCAEMLVGMVNAVTLNWLNNEDYNTQQKYRQLQRYAKESFLKNAG